MATDFERMTRRQKVLADFGEFALRCEDLGEVLAEACRLIAPALGSDLAKVLEIDRDERTALVREGVGWKPGVVGHARVELGRRSSEAYYIGQARPVYTPDIAAEERFDFPGFMQEHGVRALVNVPIFLPGGTAYGLLQVDAREPSDYGEEDAEFLRTYATILGPVIDRLHKVHHLQIALDDNKRLMQELQHRIKNHIAIITGLVRIRARAAQSDDARLELTAVGQRVEALRLVHEQLYATNSSEQMRLRPYVMQLVENLCHLHQEHSGTVRLDIGIMEVDLSADTAVPLGLILNEFVTNTLRYAFDGKGGVVSVGVEAMDGGDLLVRIADDGKGLPKDPPPARPGSGTGMKLIGALAGQIGATPEWSAAGEGGTSLRLVFKPR